MNKYISFIFGCAILAIGTLWFYTHRVPSAQQSSSTVLIVGTNSDYAPFSFREENTIVGFDIDLIHEVANRMGKTVDLRDMAFDALIPSLQMGTLQVLACGLTPTSERAQKILFTTPHIQGDPLVIITPATHALTSLTQLMGKKVAVNEGFTADSYMATIQGPELIRYATAIEAFMALENKSVDAFVSARSAVKSFIDHYGSQKFSVAEIPDSSDEYALAISKKYPELLEPMQKAINAMIADGTIAALKKKWHLS